MSALATPPVSPPPRHGPAASKAFSSLFLEELLADQARLDTPAARFSHWHETAPETATPAARYRDLIPLSKPAAGEQYAFEVKLDECTGCKACVAACHSLNGLDDTESWRDTGLLLTRQAPAYQQTITSACHHCEDPACASGCPVLAYEKDASTGIVRHLDDQCIGCSYCILKCPYDVPKFNVRLGIVRKCDMCSARLAADEAPACVQACPNGAIGIRLIPRDQPASNDSLLPGLIASDYTRPTTRYVTNRTLPEQAKPADANALQPEPAHLPLVVMLVLTQVAVGFFVASLLRPSPALLWTANLTLQAGLAASVLHLGQPLRAWRAFLGWRQSWLSREIIAFSLLAAAGALTLVGISAVGAVVTGALAVVCSIKVYEDTRRPDWSGFITTWRFGGTLALAAIFTLAALDPSWRMAAFTVLSAKLAGETLWLFTGGSDRRWRIHALPLRTWTLARLTLAVTALALLPFAPVLAWLPALAGEFAERVLFFKAVRPWKMPGS